jgi:hypothetical protein
VLFEAFVWLWRSSDYQGASSAVHPTSSSPGLLRLRDGCGLFASNNIRPTQGGAAAAARRRHGLKIEDEELLKYLVVIFVLLKLLCIVHVSFNAPIRKKKIL